MRRETPFRARGDVRKRWVSGTSHMISLCAIVFVGTGGGCSSEAPSIERAQRSVFAKDSERRRTVAARKGRDSRPHITGTAEPRNDPAAARSSAQLSQSDRELLNNGRALLEQMRAFNESFESLKPSTEPDIHHD